MIKCLKAVHDQGFQHNDLKPDNFRIHMKEDEIEQEEYKVILIDFGVAGNLLEEERQSYYAKGSPYFMSVN